jgi:7,8-dihydropterin-6-yl-methyl-4-(beta-D-ribofuranosyl)aminobenzene 5'-phosphate synthase
MRITCVVDDAVQRSSPFWAEHGLAFLIEAGGKRVLFDTGQSGTVLLHNLALLDVDPATIDALAISHGHYDHAGGLEALLPYLRPGTPLYANPDLFRERFSRREGKTEAVGLSMAEEELAEHFGLVLNAGPQEIIPRIWTTGEISERSEREGSSEYHLMRDGDALVADAYRDDMALVLQTGEYLVLLCGCCHAGLLNTLAHVRCLCERPIATIVGGLHLTSASEDDLRHIGDVLLAMPALQQVYPNHCSGEAAFVALTQILGASVVHPCPAGTILQFQCT